MNLTRRSLLASAVALLALPRKAAAERLLAAPVTVSGGWTVHGDWSKRTIFVGQHERITTVGEAWQHVRPGDTIVVRAGHTERFTAPPLTLTNVTVIGQGTGKDRPKFNGGLCA